MGDKKIGVLDMVLFTMSGVISLSTIGASAAIGVSAISWWVISILFFLIPYGLVSAELGATFVGNGGIYLWVKKAYGDFSGTIVSWFYWISVAYWMPSIFVAFTGILTQVFMPNASMMVQAVISIALVWITVAICIKDISVSKWITSLGAVLKIIVLIFLGVAGIIYGVKYGFKNDFSISSFRLTWDDSIAYVPVIAFNFLGIELIISLRDKIKNPERDIPKSIIIAGVLVAIIYIFATLGILAAIPIENINVVTGITDGLKIIIIALFGQKFLWVFKLLCIVVLFTFVPNVVTWAIGGNSVIFETDLDKKSPSIFAHKHKKYGTPDYANYLMGFIATILLVGNYIGTGSVAEVFWTIFSLSSIIVLIPYAFMFLAFVRLRKEYKDIERPYKVGGGKLGVYLTGFFGELFTLISIVFFFKPPIDTKNILRYEITLVAIILITLFIGIYIYLKTNKHENLKKYKNISLALGVDVNEKSK